MTDFVSLVISSSPGDSWNIESLDAAASATGDTECLVKGGGDPFRSLSGANPNTTLPIPTGCLTLRPPPPQADRECRNRDAYTPARVQVVRCLEYVLNR